MSIFEDPVGTSEDPVGTFEDPVGTFEDPGSSVCHLGIFLVGQNCFFSPWGGHPVGQAWLSLTFEEPWILPDPAYH